MSTTTYAVTSAPLTISDRPLMWGDSLLANTGTATIYVDDEQVRDAGSGYPLAPGGTLVWQDGQPLYAWCSTSSSLTVSSNAGAVTDAAAVAAQLRAQGLAQDIANAAYLQGIPTVDRPAILLDTGVMTVGVGIVPTFMARALDVSAYPSLYVQYTDTGAGGYTGTDARVILFEWSDPDAGVSVDVYEYGVSNASGLMRGQIITRGRSLLVEASAIAGRSSSTRLIISGSYRSLVRDNLMMSNLATAASPLTGPLTDSASRQLVYAGIAGGTGEFSDFPDYAPGDYYGWCWVDHSANLRFYDARTGQVIDELTIGAGTWARFEIHLPPVELRLALNSTVNPTNYKIGLTLKDR